MWMERGTFHGMGQPVPFVGQFAARWPDWHRQEIENAFAITVNGEQAWVTTPTGKQRLERTKLQEQLTQVRVAWAQRLFPLTEDSYRLEMIDGIDVNGRPTVGIIAHHADGRDVRFFFDKQSMLIAKIETMVISPQTGPDPVRSEAIFEAHRSFGGIKMPSKYRLFYDGTLFVESETVDYKMGATLDPRQFEFDDEG